jgi:hypothetical protein
MTGRCGLSETSLPGPTYLVRSAAWLPGLSLLIILQRQLNRSMLLQLILSKNTIPVRRQARRRFDPP